MGENAKAQRQRSVSLLPSCVFPLNSPLWIRSNRRNYARKVVASRNVPFVQLPRQEGLELRFYRNIYVTVLRCPLVKRNANIVDVTDCQLHCMSHLQEDNDINRLNNTLKFKNWNVREVTVAAHASTEACLCQLKPGVSTLFWFTRFKGKRTPDKILSPLFVIPPVDTNRRTCSLGQSL